MDFTEAAEYKFLCPSLLIGFTETKKSQIKVDGWGRSQPKVLGYHNQYRTSNKRRHVDPKHSVSNTHLSNHSLMTFASIDFDNRCPNQACHHPTIEECRQERCKTPLAARQPRTLQGQGTFSADLTEVSTDHVALTSTAKQTRSLLYGVQEMLVSTPKFEPAFHLEDVDIGHVDGLTLEQFILDVATSRLFDPEYNGFGSSSNHFSYHNYESVVSESYSHQKCRLKQTKQNKHRLKGVMSQGNLLSRAHTKADIQRAIRGADGRLIRPRTNVVAFNSQETTNHHQYHHNQYPLRNDPDVLDVPTIQFDQQNALECGHQKSTMCSRSVGRDDSSAQHSHFAYSALFSSEGHSNNNRVEGMTRPVSVASLRSMTDQTSTPSHALVIPHETTLRSSLTEGLACLRFLTSASGENASDIGNPILDDTVSLDSEYGYASTISTDERLRLYYKRHQKKSLELSASKMPCIRNGHRSTYNGDNLRSTDANNFNSKNTDNEGHRLLRVLLPDNLDSRGVTPSPQWLDVPIVSKTTAAEVILSILEKIIVELRTSETKMAKNVDTKVHVNQKAEEYELRLLDFDEVDYECPPIDPNVSLVTAKIDSVALCRKNFNDQLSIGNLPENVSCKFAELRNSSYNGEGLGPMRYHPHHPDSCGSRHSSSRNSSAKSSLSRSSNLESESYSHPHNQHLGDRYVYDNNLPRRYSALLCGLSTSAYPQHDSSHISNDLNIIGSLGGGHGNLSGVQIGKQGLPFEVSQASLSDFSLHESPLQINKQPSVSHPALSPFFPDRFSLLGGRFSAMTSRINASAQPNTSPRRKSEISSSGSKAKNQNETWSRSLMPCRKNAHSDVSSCLHLPLINRNSIYDRSFENVQSAAIFNETSSRHQETSSPIVIPTPKTKTSASKCQACILKKRTPPPLTVVSPIFTVESPLHLTPDNSNDTLTVSPKSSSSKTIINRWDFSGCIRGAQFVNETRTPECLSPPVRSSVSSPRIASSDSSRQVMLLPPRSSSLTTPRKLNMEVMESKSKVGSTRTSPLSSGYSRRQHSVTSSSIPAKGKEPNEHVSPERLSDSIAATPKETTPKETTPKETTPKETTPATTSQIGRRRDSMTPSGQRPPLFSKKKGAFRSASSGDMMKRRTSRYSAVPTKNTIQPSKRAAVASNQYNLLSGGNFGFYPCYSIDRRPLSNESKLPKHKPSGALMNRANPTTVRELISIGCFPKWKNSDPDLPCRLFVILSPKATSEINTKVDIESRDVVCVMSRLIELAQFRDDMELLRVPEDSRVFELLSYLTRTQNVSILGEDNPNPGMFYFESFFNGKRIETDVLVHTLNNQDSCLVLMRKKTNKTCKKSKYCASLLSTSKESSVRPPLEMFIFNEHTTITPVTYRCSVAVIDVAGILIPTNRRKFHFCQIVVDGRRMYHSFLHATPWDDPSSSGDESHTSIQHTQHSPQNPGFHSYYHRHRYKPCQMIDTEESDLAYNKAKSERITFFSQPQSIGGVRSLHEGFGYAPSSNDVVEKQPSAANRTPSNMNSIENEKNSLVSAFSSPILPSIASSNAFPDRDLADFFVPAHLAISDIFSVQPHNSIASQLEVTYTIPRPLGFLDAAQSEGNTATGKSSKINKENIISDLSFENVVSSYAFSQKEESKKAHIVSGNQQKTKGSELDDSITPSSIMINQVGEASGQNTARYSQQQENVTRPTLIEVNVVYVAENAHNCAELAARIRWLKSRLR